MSANSSKLSDAELVRLAELAEKLRADSIADAEVAELETLLAESAAARETFAGLAMLATELRHSHGRLAAPMRADSGEKVISLPRRRETALALAASIALIAFLGWQYLRPSPTAFGEVVAKVSNASGATLLAAGRAAKVENGAPLWVGAYELRAGFLEVAYTNGAAVLIEAPAKFELSTASRLVMHDGHLSAQVPPTAIGFTVETPTAKIVDLGTEFGVSANATVSEVHVFKGEVLVTAAKADGPQRLTESHASRIDNATGTPAGIEFAPQNFMRSLTEAAALFARETRKLNPVAYYRMRMTSDGTLLKDVAPSRHDGKVIWGRNPSPWAPGRIGAALRLDGAESGSFAMVPNLPKATNGTISVCAWVLAESRPRWASIAKNWAKDAGTTHGGQFHFGLWHDEGGLEVHVHDAAGTEVGVRENIPLPLGEWQFVAFTLDGQTLRLYRNGVEVAATPCAGLSTFAPDALGIGVKLDATGRQPELRTPGFWDGRLDELAIFHSALSAEQIRKLYESAPPLTPVALRKTTSRSAAR